MKCDVERFFHAFASQLWIVTVISSDGAQTLNFCSVPLQFDKDEKCIRCVYIHFLSQVSFMVKTLLPQNPTEPLKVDSLPHRFPERLETIKDGSKYSLVTEPRGLKDIIMMPTCLRGLIL